MNKTSIENISMTQKSDLLRKAINPFLDRELKLDFFKEEEEITIITGVRRSGKSSLLEQYIKSSENIESYIYLNFEDPQLIEFQAEDFLKLYEIWLENNDNASIRVAFFDEIQNVTGWERWMNFFAKQKGFKVFITGSNSNLLSSELGTHLTGRHRSINLYPLSFKEIATNSPQFKTLKTNRLSQEEIIDLQKLTKLYLEIGGFPRAWISQDTSILGEYYSNILIRDIVKRKNIKNPIALEKLGLALMSDIGRKINKSKIALQIGLRRGETVEKYISHFEECFLGFQIRIFNSSARKQLTNQTKFYAIDPALARRVGLPSDSKSSYYFENIVLLELLRRGGKVYYWNSREGEVDFLVETSDRKRKLIQVCWNLEDPETLKRELRGFEEFTKHNKQLRINDKIIITLEGNQTAFDNGVTSIPFYHWALA